MSLVRMTEISLLTTVASLCLVWLTPPAGIVPTPCHTDVECELNGRRYLHGTYFNDEVNHVRYYCNYGFLSKQGKYQFENESALGCLFNGQLYYVGEIFYQNNTPYFCDSGPGYQTFGNLSESDI